MLNTVLLLVVGAFVGWNIPQPSWAKSFQAKHLQKYIDKIPFLK